MRGLVILQAVLCLQGRALGVGSLIFFVIVKAAGGGREEQRLWHTRHAESDSDLAFLACLQRWNF